MKMNTRIIPVRRVEQNDVNEGLPLRGGQVPQGVQVSQGGQDDQVPIVKGGNEFSVFFPFMANGEIREALLTVARSITTQVNRDIDLG